MLFFLAWPLESIGQAHIANAPLKLRGAQAQWSYGSEQIRGIFTWNLHFWADENATDVQWNKFSASESVMQKWATMQLYFISAPLKITPHMSTGSILLLRENIYTSQRPSVQWKLQIWGRKCTYSWKSFLLMLDVWACRISGKWSAVVYQKKT